MLEKNNEKQRRLWKCIVFNMNRIGKLWRYGERLSESRVSFCVNEKEKNPIGLLNPRYVVVSTVAAHLRAAVKPMS